jgi:integrase
VSDPATCRRHRLIVDRDTPNVLSKMLKTAVEWDVLDRVRCAIRLLPLAKSSALFHDFDEFERLVSAAKDDRQAHLIVLLGGEAGLRCGEMMALEWEDVDFRKRQLTIQRSDWKGYVTTPKSGRLRRVPLTVRLEAALRDHRHLRGRRVFCSDEGGPLTQREVQGLVRRRLDVPTSRTSVCMCFVTRSAPT